MADGDFSPPLTPETPAATPAAAPAVVNPGTAAGAASGQSGQTVPAGTAVTAAVAAAPAPPSTTPEPAAASAPAAAAPATAPEPPKAEPTSPDTTPAAAAPTLLEKFDAEKTAKEKPAEAKPAEPAAEAKPTEAKPEPPKLEPVEYKYVLPEGMKMDDALKGTVHQAFDDFRADPSKGAQELLNLHKTQMQEYAQWLGQEQQRIFAETRQEWAHKVKTDAEMGGASHQTTMGVIARMRDLFVPDKDRADFDQFLRVTGAGDHPAFLRMLMRAGRHYDEAQSNSVPTNIKPPPTNGQRRATRFRDLYGQSAEGQS